eukprot:1713788-Alexandrium_andersonii.AAC.1
MHRPWPNVRPDATGRHGQRTPGRAAAVNAECTDCAMRKLTPTQRIDETETRSDRTPGGARTAETEPTH